MNIRKSIRSRQRVTKSRVFRPISEALEERSLLTSFTATAVSATQVNLAWTGVAGATGYPIVEAINGASVQIGSVGSGGSSYAVNGLSPNTAYFFNVGTSNAAGTTWGNGQYAFTPPVPVALPAAPSFTVTAVSSSQINVAWTGVAGATGYLVQEWMGGWEQIGSAGSGSGSCADLNLTSGIDYSFRVGAFNAAGTTWTNAKDAVTLPVANFPAAPSFTATAVSTNQIDLAWTAVAGATGYLVDQDVDGLWSRVSSVGAGVASDAITGLSAGTAYSFRVGASNAAGTTWAFPKYATTLAALRPPTAPSYSATVVSSTQVNLTWTAVAGATSYPIVEVINGSGTQIGSVSSGGTSYVVNGLSPNYPYFFNVGASNAAGTTWGYGQYAVTPPAVPSLTITAASSTQANLAWTGVAGATSYMVDEWVDGAWTQVGGVGVGVSTYAVDGLSPGTVYSFKVGASNMYGTSWANSQSVTTLAAAPAAPSFTATAVSSSQINLSWAGVAGATGYLVSEWINGAWKQVGSAGSGSGSFAITGLKAGTTYFFEVGSTNAYGTTWANYQTAVPRQATNITLSASVFAPVVGQTVTLTAAVNVGGMRTNTPTGSVTFKDGTTTLGTAPLVSAGEVTTATFTTSKLDVGTHSITAVYGGDAGDWNATSSAISLTIGQYTGPVYMLGVGGELQHYTNSSGWTTVATDVVKFAARSNGAYYDLTSDGVLHDSNGGGWSNTKDFALSADGSLYTLGVGGLLQRYTSSVGWTTLAAGVTKFALRSTDGAVFVLGSDGGLKVNGILTWNNTKDFALTTDGLQMYWLGTSSTNLLQRLTFAGSNWENLATNVQSFSLSTDGVLQMNQGANASSITQVRVAVYGPVKRILNPSSDNIPHEFTDPVGKVVIPGVKFGSGTVLAAGANYFVLTAKHVVTDGSGNPIDPSNIQFTFPTDVFGVYQVQKVILYPNLDLALLKLTSPVRGIQGAILSSSYWQPTGAGAGAGVGARVIQLGYGTTNVLGLNPLHYGYSTVQAVTRDNKLQYQFLQGNSFIDHGDSGGPDFIPVNYKDPYGINHWIPILVGVHLSITGETYGSYGYSQNISPDIAKWIYNNANPLR